MTDTNIKGQHTWQVSSLADGDCLINETAVTKVSIPLSLSPELASAIAFLMALLATALFLLMLSLYSSTAFNE